MDLENLRKNYTLGILEKNSVAKNPITQFRNWFCEAASGSLPEWLEINAMTLATSDLSGDVTCRTVLLKEICDDGFRFFTNYQSAKGRQISQNPQVALCLFWPHCQRQVRIRGKAVRVSSEVSDRYFQNRPRESQIGACASEQSGIVAGRQVLLDDYERTQSEYAGKPIRRPEHWGGYQVFPSSIEFWQGQPGRLHDRIRYTQSDQETWVIERLSP